MITLCVVVKHVQFQVSTVLERPVLLGFTDILTYYMGMTYLETLNYLLNTHTHVRFNQRSDRLYIDINWDNVSYGEFLIIDCYK